MTSLAPRIPRRLKLCRTSVQNGSASEALTCIPSTSRCPSMLAPMAMMAATETMRPASLTVRGAATVLEIELHQPLSNEAHHLAHDNVGAGRLKQFKKLQAVLGHRELPHGQVDVSQPPPYLSSPMTRRLRAGRGGPTGPTRQTPYSLALIHHLPGYALSCGAATLWMLTAGPWLYGVNVSSGSGTRRVPAPRSRPTCDEGGPGRAAYSAGACLRQTGSRQLTSQCHSRRRKLPSSQHALERRARSRR